MVELVEGARCGANSRAGRVEDWRRVNQARTTASTTASTRRAGACTVPTAATAQSQRRPGRFLKRVIGEAVSDAVSGRRNPDEGGRFWWLEHAEARDGKLSVDCESLIFFLPAFRVRSRPVVNGFSGRDACVLLLGVCGSGIGSRDVVAPVAGARLRPSCVQWTGSAERKRRRQHRLQTRGRNSADERLTSGRLLCVLCSCIYCVHPKVW